MVEKRLADLRNKERDCYFANEYVHPKNWRPVIEKYKNINVCMAHFGGDEWIKIFFCQPEKTGIHSPWINETIDLISNNKNAYTDISCFTLRLDKVGKIVKDKDSKKISFKMKFKEFLDGAIKGEYDDKCKVLDQILFGTDWYLTLNSYKQSDYQPYIEEFKSFLDSVNKGLWIKFSMINPYYYYGFDQAGKIESLYKGLKKDKISEKNEKLLDERRKILLGLSKGNKFGKNKMKSLEEMVKKAYEIETGRPYK